MSTDATNQEAGPMVLVAVTQAPGLPAVMHACVRLDDYEAMVTERDDARRSAESYRDAYNAVRPLASGNQDRLPWEAISGDSEAGR